MPDLKKILGELPTHVRLDYARHREDPRRTSATFVFSQSGFGFGEITFVAVDGQLFIDGERMGVEKIKELLGIAIDGAILDSDKDPERHALYNRVMRRVCGEGCSICRRGEGGGQ